MKVILIKNAVETLGYFSEQLAETFQEMGHDTYFVDYDDLVNTVDGISRFAVPEKTVLCTFNFIGLSGEEVFIEENGRYIWENQGIACINILVDHPLYYHSKLAKPPVPEMRVFCIAGGVSAAGGKLYLRTGSTFPNRRLPWAKTET